MDSKQPKIQGITNANKRYFPLVFSKQMKALLHLWSF